MTVLRTALRFVVLGIIILSTACATWFVPESRSRGHIFDEAIRGHIQFSEDDGQRNLNRIIRRDFPSGTPVADLIQHINRAGGICSAPIGPLAEADIRTTVCTYEDVNYFAFAYMNLGEPSFREGHNTFRVSIFHADGLIGSYDIIGQTLVTFLSREEYMERIARQRVDDEAQLETPGD